MSKEVLTLRNAELRSVRFMGQFQLSPSLSTNSFVLSSASGSPARIIPLSWQCSRRNTLKCLAARVLCPAKLMWIQTKNSCRQRDRVSPLTHASTKTGRSTPRAYASNATTATAAQNRRQSANTRTSRTTRSGSAKTVTLASLRARREKKRRKS